MIYYYSGCGNSRWLAQALSQQLNETLVFIPDQIRTSEYVNLDEEYLGIIFPIYAWTPPKIVMEWARTKLVPSLKNSKKRPFIFMACTCGDNIGNADLILNKVLGEADCRLDAAYSFIMPETYINLPGFSLDTLDNEQRKIQQSQLMLGKAVEQIKHHSPASEVVRGSMPRFKSGLINKIFNAWLITDKHFHVEEQCTSCGMCERVCPARNVTLTTNNESHKKIPSWGGHCYCCMACYHHCPVNAIQYGKQTKGKGQYYFGHK